MCARRATAAQRGQRPGGETIGRRRRRNVRRGRESIRGRNEIAGEPDAAHGALRPTSVPRRGCAAFNPFRPTKNAVKVEKIPSQIPLTVQDSEPGAATAILPQTCDRNSTRRLGNHWAHRGHSRRSALPDHQHRPRSPVRHGDRCRQSLQASLNEKNSATSAPAGETARCIPFSPMGARKFFAFSARHRRRRRRCRQQARDGARPPLRRDCPPAGDRPSWSERAGRTSACSDRERPSAPLRPRR